MSPDEALGGIESVEERPYRPLDSSLVRYAADLANRDQLSYRDDTIIAAAHRLNAPVVNTEELSHGATYYGAVRVVTPFKNLH
jgi:predicted nucleic acid-binding protein